MKVVIDLLEKERQAYKNDTGTEYTVNQQAKNEQTIKRSVNTKKGGKDFERYQHKKDRISYDND